MLAIRPVEGTKSSKLFRLNTFWLFTLLGMSLPYRIWFSRHCEQLRVTVVKETYAEPVPKSTFSSWFTAKSTTPPAPSTNVTSKGVFREQMQSMLLYAREREVSPQAKLNTSHVSLGSNKTLARELHLSEILDTKTATKPGSDNAASNDFTKPEPNFLQTEMAQGVSQVNTTAIFDIQSNSSQPIDENSVPTEDDNNATIADGLKKPPTGSEATFERQ